MDTKTFLENFGHIADAPNGVQKLRDLVLQLAVSGRLSNKQENDKSVNLLIDDAKAYKEEYGSKLKIRKSKPLPEMAKEEILFGVPEHWVWIRLDDVASYIQRGKGPKYVDKSNTHVVSQKCVQWSGFDITRARYVDVKLLGSYGEERFLVPGDLLWNSTGTGTVGRINVYPADLEGRVVADSHVTIIRLANIEPRYAWCFIASPWVQSRIEPDHEDSLVSGTTQQVELNTSSVKGLPIPLPPLEEQKRIVTKVEQLMTLCDQLEEKQNNRSETHTSLTHAVHHQLTDASEPAALLPAWERIRDNFDYLYTTVESVTALRQVILQLAVQGRLVPQDSSDEPASAYLSRIKAEKDILIDKGKIKKGKQLAHINQDDMPFSIPTGWEWVRLQDLAEIITKGSSPKWQGVEYVEQDKGILFITSENVGNYVLRLVKKKYVEPRFNEIEPRSILADGDILMNIVGASIGRTAVFNLKSVSANINQAVCLIRLIDVSKADTLPYLLHFLNSDVGLQYMIGNQVENARANLSMGNIAKFTIPLPPVAEQKRIVKKVDQLMSLCDQLEAKITASQSTAESYAVAATQQIAAA
ncbi:restriction endonuclease subunit S [Gammaproteobacteria bacterium]|nr:restriction endonuclease subunit S [Gammaproteobacteria bacterium]